MQKLRQVPGAQRPDDLDGPADGCPDESRAGLAEHSVEHDHAEKDRWRVTRPPDPAAPRGI